MHITINRKTGIYSLTGKRKKLSEKHQKYSKDVSLKGRWDERVVHLAKNHSYKNSSRSENRC